jgi:hypothetical protein
MALPSGFVQNVLNAVPLHEFLRDRRVCVQWWKVSYAVLSQWQRIRHWRMHGFPLLKTVPLHVQVFQYALRRRKRREQSALNDALRKKKRAEQTLVAARKTIHRSEDALTLTQESLEELRLRYPRKRGRIEVAEDF